MKSGSRLGRGLDALLKKDTGDVIQNVSGLAAGGSGERHLVDVDKILPNPFQPRREFDRDSIEELKTSIKENGLLQPVALRKKGNDIYELISGERRLRAFKELGYKRIPAVVFEVSSDTKMLEMALTENLQREDLNPIEIAHGYRQLIEECKLTQEQIAERIGKDRATIANFLRLLKLPPEVQELVADGSLSAGHARALLGIDDPATVIDLAGKVVSNQMNVRQVEAEVRRRVRIQKPRKVPSSQEEVTDVKRRYDANIGEVISKLQAKFGTRIRLQMNPSKAGEIRIEFYSQEDLNRILEILMEEI
ncbi:MAG: ParB/RepB/Spo0J family partition protein [Candidatus Kryptoniota bacterium]